ncbi:MAG: hypothetical protein M5R40_08220 [Anaerolineae bacterium]|nr:hypothetical protein [Anaerolineae bacterium]
MLLAAIAAPASFAVAQEDDGNITPVIGLNAAGADAGAAAGETAGTTADYPAAVIVNDEGGPVAITGAVAYTNPFFTSGVAAPLIILEDQAGFVDRDRSFILPAQSQTPGTDHIGLLHIAVLLQPRVAHRTARLISRRG